MIDSRISALRWYLVKAGLKTCLKIELTLTHLKIFEEKVSAEHGPFFIFFFSSMSQVVKCVLSYELIRVFGPCQMLRVVILDRFFLFIWRYNIRQVTVEWMLAPIIYRLQYI